MAPYDDLPPVVWKSDFYSTPEALELLDGAVDIYLPDFKFGNDVCARRLAGVDRYFDVVTRNLKIAFCQGDLIIRHLLLPGHFECCYCPIVNWIGANLTEAKFSVRDGYLPRWQADRHSELSRPLGRDDGERARDFARNAGLRLVY
jgi:putative pyruvate formate lyase activating enzyme